jgi:hypothetical protein
VGKWQHRFLANLYIDCLPARVRVRSCRPRYPYERPTYMHASLSAPAAHAPSQARQVCPDFSDVIVVFRIDKSLQRHGIWNPAGPDCRNSHWKHRRLILLRFILFLPYVIWHGQWPSTVHRTCCYVHTCSGSLAGALRVVIKIYHSFNGIYREIMLDL